MPGERNAGSMLQPDWELLNSSPQQTNSKQASCIDTSRGVWYISCFVAKSAFQLAVWASTITVDTFSKAEIEVLQAFKMASEQPLICCR